MIISINKGGLSNRIKSLVSCLRYANEKKIECGIIWKVLNNYNKEVHLLNCKYNKLFNIKKVSEISEDLEDILHYDTLYHSHCLMIFDKDNIPYNFNTFNSNCNIKFSYNDNFRRNIDYMYNLIPKNVIENYLPYFKRLKLIDELEQKVNDFSMGLFNDNTVSVHIRSWNRNGESGRRDFLFNIKKFEDEIERRICDFIEKGIDDFKFYLSTDSQEVKDYFTNQYINKEKIIVYPRTTRLDTSRDFPDGVQEDLIELFLLGKNKSLIGSHFSSYSEVAWWLAECPEDVVIL